MINMRIALHVGTLSGLLVHVATQNQFVQCDPAFTGSTCGVCPISAPSRVLYDLSALAHDTVIAVGARQRFAYAPCGFAGSDLLLSSYGSYDLSRCLNSAVQPSGCFCHDDASENWCGVMASELGARDASGVPPAPSPQYSMKYDFLPNPFNTNEQLLRIRYAGLPACVSLCSGGCSVTVLLRCDPSVTRSARSPNASMVMVQAQPPLDTAYCTQDLCSPCYDLATPAMCTYQPSQGCANNCSNNGVCTVNGNCACFSGWMGSLCNQPAGCRALGCSDDAGCAALDNSTYTCVCNQGYSGNGTICRPNPAVYTNAPDAFPPAAGITLVVVGSLVVLAGIAWVFIIYRRRTYGYHAVGTSNVATVAPTQYDDEGAGELSDAASRRRGAAVASAADVQLTAAPAPRSSSASRATVV